MVWEGKGGGASKDIPKNDRSRGGRWEMSKNYTPDASCEANGQQMTGLRKARKGNPVVIQYRPVTEKRQMGDP